MNRRFGQKKSVKLVKFGVFLSFNISAFFS